MITIPPKDDSIWQSFKFFVEEGVASCVKENIPPWAMKSDVEIAVSPEVPLLKTFGVEISVEGDRQAYGGYPLKITSYVYISSKCGDLFPEDLWFTKEWFSENPEPSWDEVYPIVEELIEGAIAEFRWQFAALRDDLVRLLGDGVRQGEQKE